MDFSRKISAKDIKTGIEQLSNIGNLIGKDNTVYVGLVEGISKKMNIDVEECFSNSYYREALIAEIILQNMMNGAYVDVSELKGVFQHEHWITIALDNAKKYGLK